MGTNFNEHLDSYLNLRHNQPFLKYVVNDSVLHYVGDVKGKRILDLGCGDGIFCRKFKSRGASTVVGVDISEAMINVAKFIEEQESLGIEYITKDVKELGKIGEFDIVLVNLVLVFAENQQEYESFVKVIYENLAPGGYFVGINPNPSLSKWSPESERIFGNAMTKLYDDDGGFWVTVTNLPTNPFKMYLKFILLSHEICKKIFYKCGFKEVTYSPLTLSKKSLKLFPTNYWTPFLKEETYQVLCGKK